MTHWTIYPMMQSMGTGNGFHQTVHPFKGLPLQTAFQYHPPIILI